VVNVCHPSLSEVGDHRLHGSSTERRVLSMSSDNRRMSAEEIEVAIGATTGWAVVDGRLCREYIFDDFIEAIGFMVRAAFHAEALNHHPDWSNLYNTVRVCLETHDVAGISALDFDLAAKLNELAIP
jgi:4a-hydroxytetrahydrobiopterin dehydratase